MQLVMTNSTWNLQVTEIQNLKVRIPDSQGIRRRKRKGRKNDVGDLNVRWRGSISEPETNLAGIFRESICVSSSSKGKMRLRKHIPETQCENI